MISICFGSFLDDPLNELVQISRLRDIAIWRTKWESYLLPDLRAGDFDSAIDGLREAGEFKPSIAPDAGRAAAGMRVVEAALGDLQGTGEIFTRDGVEPAMGALLAWADLLSEEELDPKLKRQARDVLYSKNSRAWDKALKACEDFESKRGEVPDKAARLLGGLEGGEGRFLVELREELRTAFEAQEWTAFQELAAGAARRPASYLATEFIGW